MNEPGANPRIGTRLARWLRRSLPTPKSRVFAVATTFCIVLGLWLRARGFLYDVSAFWVDECTWAVMLMELPLVDLLIRPPGFMAVSKLSAAIFGPTENAFRLLPWCAGIAVTLFSPALARRLFSAPAARLLFVAVIALHPCATSFAKEYKPYAVSLTLHLALLLLTLRYVESKRGRDLAWLLGAAFVGGLFAQDLVFAYPGVFLVIGWDAWRDRRGHLPAVAAGAGAIVTALVAQYVLIWSRLPKEESDFWGKKYKVFYTESVGTYADWLVDRYVGVTAFPGYQMKFWDAPWLSSQHWATAQSIFAAAWLVLHVVGVVTVLFRRRFRLALLLLLPIATVWLFNLAGFWPFGVFRTNLFLIGYSAALAAAALDYPRRRWESISALLPAAVLIVIPLLWFERGWGPTKRALTYVSRFPEILTWVANQNRGARGPELLLVDRRTCDPWRYYSEYNPTTSRLRPKLDRAFRMECIEKDPKLGKTVSTALAANEPVWLLFNTRNKTKAVIESATRTHQVIATGKAPGYQAVGFEGRPPTPTETPAGNTAPRRSRTRERR